ncbi:MAG: ORF6N domain-containing protein [Candidatus Margulisiibacteriota bacterium]|jgi:hypothetical protein
MNQELSLVSPETIENKILIIRGKKVILDKDLAQLYGVMTKVLNQSVLRNLQRFPEDFMFRLDQNEYENLRSQFVTSSSEHARHGGRRYLPYAFTENGVAMLSSVLNSEKAIAVNIQIMRVFTQLRQLIMTHKDILQTIDALERKSEEHGDQISVLFENIRQLLNPPTEGKKKPIGFGR